MARKRKRQLTAAEMSDLLKVHEGEDGWLFLVGGPNRPLDAYGHSLRRWWLLRRWAALVRRRERRVTALGARYLHVVVPEKLSVYAEKAPELSIDAGRATSRALGRLLGGARSWLDAAGALDAGKSRRDMYLRTDTHWTTEGCHAVYLAMCEALAVQAPLDLAERDAFEQPFSGDLGQKLDPQRGETLRRRHLPRHAERVFASELVRSFENGGNAFALHRGAHVIFRNDHATADRRSLVLFGDSCAHFEPILLTGMLAETFREVHFLWSASVDWAYLERVRPDIVVTEIAERFMSKVPGDHYDQEAFAAQQLRQAAPAQAA